MKLLSVLSDLMEAIEAAPDFVFGEDLAACRSIDHFATDEQVAARIATLIQGCRATAGFPFGADVAEAERALLKFGFAAGEVA